MLCADRRLATVPFMAATVGVARLAARWAETPSARSDTDKMSCQRLNASFTSVFKGSPALIIRSIG
jgi:hypothetical protein